MRAYPSKMLMLAALGLCVPAVFGSAVFGSAAYGAARPSHAAKAASRSAGKHSSSKPAETAHAVLKGRHGHVEPASEELPAKGRKSRTRQQAEPVQTKLVHGRRVPVHPIEAAEPVRTKLVHGRRVPVEPAEVAAPVRYKLVHGRRVPVQPEPEPVKTRLVHGRRVVVSQPEPAPRLLARVQRPAAPSIIQAAAQPDPAPEAPPALDPIHVTHDRKQHFQAGPPANNEPSASNSEPPADHIDDAPRKATTADFLSVGTPPAPLPASARPVRAAAQKPAGPAPATIIRTSPTAGVVVGARVELKPTPLAPVQIAPEPLVSLYDKRGRLIVPPALKGSHEVLVHQNVMADSDGLERVQDDEDLSRMRANKMLVALPENEGIQTDERLPYNRRYSRPWTAAFLTALARAHYARFHTPLQVNSAVRTVEFQHQLIRTNGNAAPAEGETASPHLTGQAVDLAKHGLSMTEIAWLRGYLLPLVQEGKVDVEEEFQQACFHISVYKKYLPQPAGKRSIADKHLPGSTLAVALP